MKALKSRLATISHQNYLDKLISEKEKIELMKHRLEAEKHRLDAEIEKENYKLKLGHAIELLQKKGASAEEIDNL